MKATQLYNITQRALGHQRAITFVAATWLPCIIVDAQAIIKAWKDEEFHDALLELSRHAHLVTSYAVEHQMKQLHRTMGITIEAFDSWVLDPDLQLTAEQNPSRYGKTADFADLTLAQLARCMPQAVAICSGDGDFLRGLPEAIRVKTTQRFIVINPDNLEKAGVEAYLRQWGCA